ncbi:MAG: acyl-CoA thioesterase, partial [bacterium]
MENHQLVRTEHLNHKGNLFGGQMLLWVDECAYMAARKDYPDLKLVTRAISDVQFRKSIPNGSVLNISCTKNRIGKTSVTYDVSVISFPPQKKKV